MAESWREFQEFQGALWADDGLIPWSRASGRGAVAEVELHGGLEPAKALLVIRAHVLPFPSGQFTVLWRNERVVSVDLNGPAHLRVLTPHRQWIDENGEHVEALDLDALNLRTFAESLRWFLTWTRIRWRFEYTDPPLQSSVPTLERRRKSDKKP